MQKIKKGLLAVLFCLAMPAVFGCGKKEPLYTSCQMAEETNTTAAENAVETAAAGNLISSEAPGFVYVCGAVVCPGVYEISGDMRIRDAIEAAGWFSEEADQEWLNQAERISDGQRIYVYTCEETRQLRESGISMEADFFPGEEGGSSAQMGETGKININTATREELMTLPGIGEAKADAILKYRSEYGAFSTIEEIQNISGIKSGVFSKIQDLITV